MPIRIVADTEKRKARRGQFRTAKKYVPDVAKTAQHPHSKLKTQKELKKITDSGDVFVNNDKAMSLLGFVPRTVENSIVKYLSECGYEI